MAHGLALEQPRTVIPQQNLLVNGGFEIWQRGAGPFTTNLGFSADRWSSSMNGSSTFSISRESTIVDVGSRYSMACAYTYNALSAIAQQPVEDFHQLRGKTVTVSLRVRAPAVGSVGLGITDGWTYVYGARNISNGQFETIKLTHTLAANAASCVVFVWGYSSGTFYIDNAMMVIGTEAQEYIPMHPADEIARCQRYYEVMGGVTGTGYYPRIVGTATAASQFFGTTLAFAAHKGGVPTATKNGTWGITNSAQPGPGAPTPQGTHIYLVSIASGVVDLFTDDPGDTLTYEWNP